MEWKGYQISLRLLSPLHIGWRKSGNLQQTRPYITGRALWGALTARLTRESGKSNYQEVGQWVDERLAFTYFYPSDCEERVRLWPWGEEWDEFAWTYLSSYVSTSLADGHTAEEGSLHETEFIAPRTREGKQVYLLGYIFQREDWDDLGLDLRATLNKLQIGGERGYGWGRLSLCAYADCSKNPPNNSACYFKDFEFDVSAPILKAASGQARLLAHTIADPSVMTCEIEPLLGRLTDENGQFGQKHSEAAICRKPGSIISKGDEFIIKSKGLWQRLVR